MRHPDRNWIAIIIAVGLSTALNLIVTAILYDAIQHPDQAGISDNAVQILSSWGGGMIGILGVVFGYQAGTRERRSKEEDRDEPDSAP